jgi:hypothetical protein
MDAPARASVEPSSDGPLRPHLASQALIEDLAPLEPARRLARLLCLSLGLVFVAAGGLLELGPRAGLSERTVPAVLLGGLAIVAGVTPVSYRQRALALVTLAYVAGLLGLRNLGPAAGIAPSGPGWGFFQLLASTVLPAALLFRARYRAYPRARWILGLAFVLSAPFMAHAGASLLADELHLSHLGTLAALVATMAGLAGFMGAETTGAGSYVALGIVAGSALSLGTQLLQRPGALFFDAAVVVVAFLAVVTMATVGSFQLLAARFAADARRIDPRKGAPTPKRRPPPSEPTGFLSED